MPIVQLQFPHGVTFHAQQTTRRTFEAIIGFRLLKEGSSLAVHLPPGRLHREAEGIAGVVLVGKGTHAEHHVSAGKAFRFQATQDLIRSGESNGIAVNQADMRIQYLVSFFVNRTAEDFPQYFNGAFLLGAALAAGVVVSRRSAQNSHRIAAVRTEDDSPLAPHNYRLQLAGVFGQHLPVIPGIRDDRDETLRMDFGDQPAKGFNFPLALAHTHHAVFRGRNAGADKLIFTASVIIPGIQQRRQAIGTFEAGQMSAARLRSVVQPGHSPKRKIVTLEIKVRQIATGFLRPAFANQAIVVGNGRVG